MGRILIISHLFPSTQVSASGRFVEDQANAVRAQGIEPTILTVRFRRLSIFRPFDFISGLIDGLLLAKVRVGTTGKGLQYFELQCPAPRLGGVVQAWLYGLCARRFIGSLTAVEKKFEMIHAHTALLDGYAALKVSKLLGVPYLVTEHTGPFRSLLVRAGSKSLLSDVFSGASSVVAVSSALRRDMLKCFPSIESKLSIIANTFSAEEFQFAEAAPIEETVGWLGYMSPVKRIDRLLLVFAAMKSARPNLTLKLISMQKLPEIHMKLARDLGIDGSIVYASANSRSQVAKALGQLSLLMVTSDTETFSVACLEALAVGTPVVSTDCGGPSDILLSPEDGAIVFSNDPSELARAAVLLLDGNVNSPFSRKARAQRALENFGELKIGRSYAALYQKLLSANNS